jgi:hypothetical protein
MGAMPRNERPGWPREKPKEALRSHHLVPTIFPRPQSNQSQLPFLIDRLRRPKFYELIRTMPYAVEMYAAGTVKSAAIALMLAAEHRTTRPDTLFIFQPLVIVRELGFAPIIAQVEGRSGVNRVE